MRSSIFSAVTFCVLLSAPAAHPAESERMDRSTGSSSLHSTGCIRGFVRTESDSLPISYANIILTGTLHGASSLDDGSFLLSGIDPGRYTVAVMAMHYCTARLPDVIVVSGDTTTILCTLTRAGLTAAAAAAESIGVEITLDSDDLPCDITPGKPRFRVGDEPAFDVIIYNRSADTIYLPLRLDGSTQGVRFPHASISIDGPADGISSTSVFGCGYINQLQTEDFVKLEPGDLFRPFAGMFRFSSARNLTFAKPGRYTVTFTYSTDEGDIREWLGTNMIERIPPALSKLMRRVPRVTIIKSIEVDVVE